MSFPKRADKNDAYAADQGMPYLAGAARPGVSVQNLRITQVGAAPLIVDLVALGLQMDDALYNVHTGGDTASATKVVAASITPNGFNVTGGINGEVHHITVIGTLKNQAKNV